MAEPLVRVFPGKFMKVSHFLRDILHIYMSSHLLWPCTEYFETFKPGALRPVCGATASLGGRYSTDYYGSADLPCGIGYLPAYPPRLEEAAGISGFDSHSNLSADVGLLPTPWRGVPRLECVSIIVKILLDPVADDSEDRGRVAGQRNICLFPCVIPTPI